MAGTRNALSAMEGRVCSIWEEEDAFMDRKYITPAINGNWKIIICGGGEKINDHEGGNDDFDIGKH